MKEKWEHFPEADYTTRLKVWGGWIVKYVIGDGNSTACSMVFIPDSNHEWII